MKVKEITKVEGEYLGRKHTSEVEGEVLEERLVPKRLPLSLHALIVLHGAGLVGQHRVEGLALRKAGVFQLL